MSRIFEYLKIATNGLMYPSDSDEPWKIAQYSQPPTLESVARDLGLLENIGLNHLPLDLEAEFDELCDGDERYNELEVIINHMMQDVQAFRLTEHEPRITIIIFGRSVVEDVWVLLKTLSVET